jgi:septal ring factor EnvC (AmiA/AmiB activator)
LVIDDPLDVAIQFLQTADQVQCALQADIKAREARLAQTRQAQDAIAAKAQELQLEQSNYRLQTARLDQAQSKETQALAANLEALQRLGKPNATASPQA